MLADGQRGVQVDFPISLHIILREYFMKNARVNDNWGNDNRVNDNWENFLC